jgi:hypothetical protein
MRSDLLHLPISTRDPDPPHLPRSFLLVNAEHTHAIHADFIDPDRADTDSSLQVAANKTRP